MMDSLEPILSTNDFSRSFFEILFFVDFKFVYAKSTKEKKVERLCQKDRQKKKVWDKKDFLFFSSSQ